ncbi:hypothetical protein NM208_g12291 [Fusarium decemcellulare]|uniref:Uncharacterized protein n=1 Tax=Fusarium decemcellulare TaxID=57161 RepID=A0ACC1RP70_9HYPO|nr:hypothetical protein NM208_g12291 [Fusarium decemcellulare]
MRDDGREGVRKGDDKYLTVHDNFPVLISPDSSAVGRAHEWVIYHRFFASGTQYLEHVTAVDPAWLVAGSRLLSSGPSWSKVGRRSQVPTCANVSCRSIAARLKNIAFYIEDTITNIWRCLICDWGYSIFGQEILHGFLHDPSPEQAATASQPLPHHLFKSTSGSVCGFYVSFSGWDFLPGGGFACGTCSPRSCANKHCTKHKALAQCILVRDDELNDRFCITCSAANRQRVARKQPKHKDFITRVKAIPKDRKCSNPNCGRTREEYKGRWCFMKGDKGDEAYVLYLSCTAVFDDTDKQRVPQLRHKLGSSLRTCFNCAKTEVKGNTNRNAFARDENDP